MVDHLDGLSRIGFNSDHHVSMLPCESNSIKNPYLAAPHSENAPRNVAVEFLSTPPQTTLRVEWDTTPSQLTIIFPPSVIIQVKTS